MNSHKNKVFTNEERKLLFLHGYLADRRSFNYQLSFFERDFEVFAPDLKGFGENIPMEYPYSLDDYINDVCEYMYKNGVNCPSVIAHSFGARIAIKASATNENLFNKLVLTGAAGLKPRRTIKKALNKATFSVLKKFVPKERLKVFYSPDYLSLEGVMKESFVKIIGEHLDGYIENVKNQTLLVFGAKDKETPLYMAKRLNKGIKNSKLIVINNAGHFCFIDKSAKFNVEVKEFLLS